MARPPQNASPFSQKLAAAATARGSPSRASRDFALQNPPPGTEPENPFRSQWLNQTHKQHAADPHQRLQRQPFPVLSDQISVDFSSKQLSFAPHPETSTRYPPVSLSFIVLECISLSSPFFALMISRHESQQGHCSSRAKGRIRKMFSREDLASREGLYKSQNCAAREFCARLKHARAAPAV